MKTIVCCTDMTEIQTRSKELLQHIHTRSSVTLLKTQYLKMLVAAPLYCLELLHIIKSFAFQNFTNLRERERSQKTINDE